MARCRRAEERGDEGAAGEAGEEGGGESFIELVMAAIGQERAAGRTRQGVVGGGGENEGNS